MILTSEMKQLSAYIEDVIGIVIDIQSLDKAMTNKLPMYLNEGYRWQKAMLANRPCILGRAT